MYQLNEKLSGMEPYEPAEGDFAVRLDANESFVKLPISLYSKFAEEMASIPFNRYPDPMARKLCRAFADYYEVAPELVTASNGSDEMIFILLSAFLQKGEKVLLAEPDFSMYRFYTTLTENIPVVYQKGETMEIDPDEFLQTAEREKVSMILFSNPCNPTSVGLRREQVRRIVEGTNALVVLDEAYMDFWDQSLLGDAAQYDNLIILRTCSKAFGLAAARLGFAVANPALTRAIRSAKSPYNVNSLSQKLGTVVLEEVSEQHKALRRIRDSKTHLFGLLLELQQRGADIQPIDGVTNFIVVKTPRAEEIHKELAARQIAVRRFPGFLRITVGSLAENSRLIAELENILL